MAGEGPGSNCPTSLAGVGHLCTATLMGRVSCSIFWQHQTQHQSLNASLHVLAHTAAC